MQYDAQIIKSFGRNFIVKTYKNECFQALTRSKSIDFACGDQVLVTIINNYQAVIEKYYPRSSIIYRQYNKKIKLLASNVNQILFVISPFPLPNFNLLQRVIIAAESQRIKILIIANKSDLINFKLLSDKLNFYSDLGYKHINFSIFDHNNTLLLLKIQDNCNLLVGQSGVGKSSILNSIVGTNIASIDQLSTWGKGKHTTTFTSLHQVNENTSVIDSPGLQIFGLDYINLSKLIDYFPDFRDLNVNCKFKNCAHINEIGCEIIKKSQYKIIHKDRLVFYQTLYKELENNKKFL